jgi:ERF superfamily
MSIEAQKLTTMPPRQEGPPILHVFERALRDVSLPIERAREIYQLQREIEADLAEQEYIRVRSLVEQELEPVAKDASNPQTRSKYATLAAVIAAVRPVYSKHGIVVEFDTADSPRGEAWIRVLAFLSHESGYKRTYHIDMPADGKGAQGRDVMTRTHATGSAFTYGRRYLLLGIFNIAVEDDDGNAAGKKASAKAEPPAMLNEEQEDRLLKAIEDSGRSQSWFRDFAKIDEIHELDPGRLEAAIAYINKLPKVADIQKVVAGNEAGN